MFHYQERGQGPVYQALLSRIGEDIFKTRLLALEHVEAKLEAEIEGAQKRLYHPCSFKTNARLCNSLVRNKARLDEVGRKILIERPDENTINQAVRWTAEIAKEIQRKVWI
jgi:hypothetical protein